MQKNSQLTKLTSEYIDIPSKDPNDCQDLSLLSVEFTQKMVECKKTNVQESFHKDWNF